MTENQNFEMQNPLFEKTPAATAKRLLASQGFLFVVIFQIISLVFSVITAFGNKGLFSALMQEAEILNESLDDTLVEILEALQPYIVVMNNALLTISFITLIPTFLLTLGLAFMHFGAKKNDDKMAANGAYIASIFSAINLIVPIFYILVMILVGVIVIAFEPDAMSALIVTILILSIPFIFAIIYHSKLIDTLIGLRNTLKTGIHACKVYSYVIVLNWIAAVLNLISGFGAMTNNIFGAVSTILSAVALIIINLKLSDYKHTEGVPEFEDMKRAKEAVRNMK